MARSLVWIRRSGSGGADQRSAGILPSASRPGIRSPRPLAASRRPAVDLGGESRAGVADGGRAAGSFCPGRFTGVLPLRRFGALENFAGTAEPLNSAGSGQAAVNVALLADIRGRIEAFEGNRAEDVPLVVRTAVGFGETTFVAVDLDGPLVGHWRARPEFLAAARAEIPPRRPSAARRRGRGCTTATTTWWASFGPASISFPTCGSCRFGSWPS